MEHETPIPENITEVTDDTPATDENIPGDNTTSDVPDTEPETETEPQPDIERLISEAEQRGYIRGLNEQAARLFDRPAIGQQPEIAPAPIGTDSEVMILNRSKVSVWNR